MMFAYCNKGPTKNVLADVSQLYNGHIITEFNTICKSNRTKSNGLQVF